MRAAKNMETVHLILNVLECFSKYNFEFLWRQTGFHSKRKINSHLFSSISWQEMFASNDTQLPFFFFFLN